MIDSNEYQNRNKEEQHFINIQINSLGAYERTDKFYLSSFGAKQN